MMEQPDKKYFGKYKGFVRDNVDPEGRGRIRVFCPQIMGGKSDSPTGWLGWAEACFPWMGGINTLDFGVPMTKEENDGEEIGVWIEFEGGNPDFPVWTGTFVVAPTNDGVLSQLPLASAAGEVGGSILQGGSSLGSGTDTAALTPPKPLERTKETRLLVKKGRDLVLGCAKGGYIILGPSGVHLVGVLATINGRLVNADLGEVSG